MERNAHNTRPSDMGFDWREAAEMLSSAYDHSWPAARMLERLLDGFGLNQAGGRGR